MDEDLFELQAEFYNDFIWTDEFVEQTKVNWIHPKTDPEISDDEIPF